VQKENMLTQQGYTLAQLQHDVRNLTEQVQRNHLLYQRLTSATVLRAKVKALQLPLFPALPLPELKKNEPQD